MSTYEPMLDEAGNRTGFLMRGNDGDVTADESVPSQWRIDHEAKAMYIYAAPGEKRGELTTDLIVDNAALMVLTDRYDDGTLHGVEILSDSLATSQVTAARADDDPPPILTVEVYKENGVYWARVPEKPGLYTQENSVAAVLDDIAELLGLPEFGGIA